MAETVPAQDLVEERGCFDAIILCSLSFVMSVMKWDEHKKKKR